MLLLKTCNCFSYQSIEKIDSFLEVFDILQEADKETLIVFDVDQTLIKQCDIIFRPEAANNEFVKLFNNEVAERHKEIDDPVYWECLWTKQLLFNVCLVEPIILDIIKNLQERGVKTIALTHMRTGSVGIIPNMQHWRFEQLRELGIDFSTSFSVQELFFTDLAPNNGNYPAYYKGILCTGRTNSKGETLKAFLDYLGWRPSKVIYIDDKEKFVVSVQELMEQYNIPFQGFIYEAVYKQPLIVDPYIIAIQQNYFKEHSDYICDADAAELLNQRASLSL